MPQSINPMTNLKSYLQYLYPIFIVFLLSSAISFFYGYYNYFDPINFCAINIDGDFLNGNKKTIQDALVSIKNTDKLSYKNICQYVSLISENFCPINHSYGGSLEYNNQPGCYIKGSKIIYLNPTKETSQNIIDQRAQAIKKYTELSKSYWSKPN